MSKRKFNLEQELGISDSNKKRVQSKGGKKHSLDSDEEDDIKDTGVLHSDDIEGEEEGVSRQEEGYHMTAFNMKEEMEEGHFDNNGHFIWKNSKEIRDNWLDNVEWHKIKNDPNSQYNLTDTPVGLGEESDSSDTEKFDELKNYRDILKLMKPGETVNKALNRLGGSNKKLSSVERLKRKKAGTLVENQDVTRLTALANDNLTSLGNMDIYQETYEEISDKINKKSNPMQSESDMFGDDFDTTHKFKTPLPKKESAEGKSGNEEVMWEYKWDQENDEIHGPHSSSQMLQWVQNGHFKNGVFVRKHGENSSFYTSNRIDFDLYI
ncbi:hypothetical protein HHI36_012051 [Cryptolaemus montrouzieri]|uniref:GYF domain-containing protein n=1 Tax=Cryptolaemus montrouzieri TaxID=559131 RepID=A0ABD2ND66_9CUCU